MCVRMYTWYAYACTGVIVISTCCGVLVRLSASGGDVEEELYP